MIISLYLALVLSGIIIGTLIGFCAPASLFIESHEEAQEWATLVNDEIDTDFAFQSMMNRIMAPKNVIVNWREINTPSLTRAACELLEDWSNAISCQMDILALARTGDSTRDLKAHSDVTREIVNLNITSKRKPKRKATRKAGKVKVSCNY